MPAKNYLKTEQAQALKKAFKTQKNRNIREKY